MSALANEHKAVNLSQGFPDFNVSPDLIGLVEKYMKEGYNQYAPMPGVPELREKISKKINELYNYQYDAESEITITAGGTQALYSAITAIVQEDDEVIIFEPAYDSYAPVVRLNGGQPVYIKLKAPDYHVDWEDVNKLITARTRLIIINTPHNPTGKLFSEEDMKMLSKVVSGTKILILCDEVYEHITFDNEKHESIAKYPKLAERSLLVYSFGKMCHATGWKLGYCVAPKLIMKEFRKIHQFNVFAVNTPIQYAMSEYLDKKERYIELGTFYQQKRDKFNRLLTEIGFEISPAKGSYFQTIDFSKYTKEKDVELAERLIKEYGIASVPMSAFYHDNNKSQILRFCFAKSDETLAEAAEKLRNFYKSI